MRSIEDIYQDAKAHWGKSLRLQEQAEKEKEAYYADIDNYRMASANRVLDFVRSNLSKMDERNINLLLCHCQNKLNGNIDGTELTLDEHFFKEEFKTNDN